jgi:hypothetical protein
MIIENILMHATEELLEVQMLCRASADGNMHIYIYYIYMALLTWMMIIIWWRQYGIPCMHHTQ